ncbi:MAG: hypothetical protein QOJ90_308 [Actinomycetota bacterium]|nr:hypothetical protein [Actinomycetota bacterium]MDQ1640957.1 hypothetical protein [Actinomycetota bacterium]
MTPAANRRLWRVAGALLIAYVVLTFAGVSLEHSLMLGDSPSKAASALVHSSLTRNFTGGYVEYLATLVYLVGALLVARLLRGDGVVGDWLSSCIAAGAVVAVAITVAVGFAAGAAAMYDAHHGAPLTTVTTVNDIRNFAFFLTGGLSGIFALSVAGAIWLTRELPTWVAYSGAVVGILSIAAVAGAGIGLLNVSTMLAFLWIVALGVAALRHRGEPAADPPVRRLADATA